MRSGALEELPLNHRRLGTAPRPSVKKNIFMACWICLTGFGLEMLNPLCLRVCANRIEPLCADKNRASLIGQNHGQ